jgi:uncharacterized protein (TIGR03066 family)
MLRTLSLVSPLLGIALFFSVYAKADDPKDKPTPDKLMGAWKVIKEGQEPVPPSTLTTVEFLKDNKLKLTITINNEPKVSDGTWKLEGMRLTTTLKMDGKDKTDVVEITKLDEMKLEFKDATGKMVTMERTKIIKK